jgi:hypothetical protein
MEAMREIFQRVELNDIAYGPHPEGNNPNQVILAVRPEEVSNAGISKVTDSGATIIAIPHGQAIHDALIANGYIPVGGNTPLQMRTYKPAIGSGKSSRAVSRETPPAGGRPLKSDIPEQPSVRSETQEVPRETSSTVNIASPYLLLVSISLMMYPG